jgi:PAS domain S-box-containing protein
MPPAALPANEPERLSRLRGLVGVLDSLPERAYDDITALAQALCGTPIALITLVDEERQWFKSRRGVPVHETTRELALCAHAILTPHEVMVVEDASCDLRFRGNPMVLPDGPVGFYAAAPIVTDDGLALGTVCVVDRQPRRIEGTERDALCDALRRLAGLVSALMQHEKERRDAQAREAQELLARTERLTAMAAAGLDLQAYIDADGIYRHVNQTYLDYNGCEAADVIGKHVAQHVGEALYRDVVGLQLTRALRGEPVFYQRQVEYKGRGARHMEVALLPVRDDDGKLCGVVLRAHDIEALKKNEARLNRTVALLERKTLEQQRFIHLLSHDLREPVNSVNNFATLLVDDHLPEFAPKARHYLGFVREGGQRLGRLIDNLVEFAQLDTRAPRIEAVDAAQVMRQVKDELAPLLLQYQGRLEIGPLPVLMADAASLRLALHCLISNALKFSRPGVPPLVQVSAAREAGFDQLHVRDNGIGIAQEHQGSVFEMFTRLHNRRQHDGSGLGLSICQRVADLHQGRLTLQSRPDEGSLFTLHLPTADTA